jgi:hypothetical protein
MHPEQGKLMESSVKAELIYIGSLESVRARLCPCMHDLVLLFPAFRTSRRFTSPHLMLIGVFPSRILHFISLVHLLNALIQGN